MVGAWASNGKYFRKANDEIAHGAIKRPGDGERNLQIPFNGKGDNGKGDDVWAATLASGAGGSLRFGSTARNSRQATHFHNALA